MEPTGLLHDLISVSLVTQGVAFLPSQTQTLPDTDYTLTVLTEASILQVVARYFEDSNPDRYSAGDLTNLDPLNPSSLFMKHYGECASWNQFVGAIKTITDNNIRISNDLRNTSEWHFNGNQINAGHQKMKSIRSRILQQLTAGDENAPDYDVARMDCGRFLHLAHSFYSNANWIELNGQIDPDVIRPSYNLGKNSKN
ncbi:von Willebrand factor A domain-containing protein 7-like [Asterias rubens]|uniref:von Willebrand factor A domain-containing protein 7-like n=1 Tax=Asterias rubens TaxID=7604 RepID=UPI001454F047|nr:von Willebrand factor A domain-containing protein 7-like [Asterias rubens]